MTASDTLAAALHEACARAQFDPAEATPLHEHANAIFLLPSRAVVVRLSDSPDDRKHAPTTVALTRWLVDQGFPATAPVDAPQPLDIMGYVVTFWHYYPQANRTRPNAGELGAILRELHRLPMPPVDLDPYRPLHELGQVVERSTTLPEPDRKWLLVRRNELLAAYEQLQFPLGYGFIHGDSYPGNTLWDGSRALLSDWDEAATGPRELDLVNTHQGARFGRSQEERAAFNTAYGYDVTQWNGFPILREMRDLHTLSSYIRLADKGNEAAGMQFSFRLHTLKSHATDARWDSQ